MSGKATSTRNRAEVRQLPPERCANPSCRKRVPHGDGKFIAGVGVVCTHCQARQDTTQPERPA
jgi:hypothetical protein